MVTLISIAVGVFLVCLLQIMETLGSIAKTLGEIGHRDALRWDAEAQKKKGGL